MKGSKIIVLSVVFLATLFSSSLFGFEVKTRSKTFEVSVLSLKTDVAAIIYEPETANGKPVLVMVHGATYGKWMWDVPGASWKDRLSGELGYTLVAVDLPGYGDSSHLCGDIYTPANNAIAMGKVLRAIKDEMGRDMVWIGHSFGALVGNLVAGADNGLIDGLVDMGWLHCDMSFSLDNFGMIFDGDYITAPIETRMKPFYYKPNSDSSVYAYDAAHALPMPRGNAWYCVQADKYLLHRIEIPVLVSAGDRDFMLAGYSLEEEASLFDGSVSVTTYLQPDSAHLSPLHKNYRDLINRIDGWVQENI